jgi:hypothetical protein
MPVEVFIGCKVSPVVHDPAHPDRSAKVRFHWIDESAPKETSVEVAILRRSRAAKGTQVHFGSVKRQDVEAYGWPAPRKGPPKPLGAESELLVGCDLAEVQFVRVLVA